jgi:hypothetical protein
MEPVNVVETLERRLLPRLEEAAAELRRRHPSLRIDTWSWSVGSSMGYQGHDVGIDCLDPDARPIAGV